MVVIQLWGKTSDHRSWTLYTRRYRQDENKII
jgi:hypothetical protein